MKGIILFFDHLEDVVRTSLSHYPILYSVIGGTGLVLFWRGVWYTADTLELMGGIPMVLFSPAGSVLLGLIILLGTGLLVSVFVGDRIIMSGVARDKKIIEKTEKEIIDEVNAIDTVNKKVSALQSFLFGHHKMMRDDGLFPRKAKKSAVKKPVARKRKEVVAA